jgi:hypothetical protein
MPLKLFANGKSTKDWWFDGFAVETLQSAVILSLWFNIWNKSKILFYCSQIWGPSFGRAGN